MVLHFAVPSPGSAAVLMGPILTVSDRDYVGVLVWSELGVECPWPEQGLEVPWVEHDL